MMENKITFDEGTSMVVDPFEQQLDDSCVFQFEMEFQCNLQSIHMCD